MVRHESGEQPKGNIISQVAEKHTADPPGEDDDGHHGALKRFSAMWSSFRKGKRDREYRGAAAPSSALLFTVTVVRRRRRRRRRC
ncbi:hypothetical protein EYF80_046841 [Liparis tanakae]|uniref:Uncharacterized protein n=1 Tax=Liparis tanakae TaxID=230148 RepID=A0A4Z2FP33_9TELE|nr:hypothetical protein EYF80_046841 [Liparis tanakae]